MIPFNVKQAIVCAAVSAAAQTYAQTYITDAANPDILHLSDRVAPATRSEFILPDSIAGYVPVRADLHVHTVYSDGDITPVHRVYEAWLDGLDAIAITDHLENHGYDAEFIDYLGKTVPEGTEAHNVKANLAMQPLQDLNASVRATDRYSRIFGITVIPGAELSRTPQTTGHWNFLFTTDNNSLYDGDPMECIRKAKAQGALVMQNHPGWRRKSTELTDFDRQVYGEGMVDGIEVHNEFEFYPGAIDRAAEKGLFVAAGTDVHDATAEQYKAHGYQRDFTLVLAADKSTASLKEALISGRTIAYASGGTVAGAEELLSNLAYSCLVPVWVGDRLMLRNPTSLRFNMQQTGKNPVLLPEFSSIMLRPDNSGKVELEILNFWTGKSSHLKVEFNK